MHVECLGATRLSPPPVGQLTDSGRERGGSGPQRTRRIRGAPCNGDTSRAHIRTPTPRPLSFAHPWHQGIARHPTPLYHFPRAGARLRCAAARVSVAHPPPPLGSHLLPPLPAHCGRCAHRAALTPSAAARQPLTEHVCARAAAGGGATRAAPAPSRPRAVGRHGVVRRRGGVAEGDVPRRRSGGRGGGAGGERCVWGLRRLCGGGAGAWDEGEVVGGG